jgi:hypothetical protein
MQRDLCKAKRKRSFPLIGIIEGRKISSKVFLVGPPGGSSRVKWWCMQQAKCKSERKKNE